MPHSDPPLAPAGEAPSPPPELPTPPGAEVATVAPLEVTQEPAPEPTHPPSPLAADEAPREAAQPSDAAPDALVETSAPAAPAPAETAVVFSAASEPVPAADPPREDAPAPAAPPERAERPAAADAASAEPQARGDSAPEPASRGARHERRGGPRDGQSPQPQQPPALQPPARPPSSSLPLATPAVAPRAAAPVVLELPEEARLMAAAFEQAQRPMACPLCSEDGGLLVARLPSCRVVRARESGFPAFYRVIWNTHVAEWTDLDEADQLSCMRVLGTVERTLRELLQPTKINLASLGNAVAHLHWHVVARFDWDSHYPAPVWAAPQRRVDPAHMAVLEALMPQVDEALRQRLLPW